MTPANEIKAIQIEAHHAGEPLKTVYGNDGLWRTRLTELFGEAEATKIMVQIEVGVIAQLSTTVTRETLEKLHFHKFA
jgi:hypothetical protein